MRPALAFALSASCVAAALAATTDAPPRVVGSTIETRSAGAGLEPAYRAAVAAARGPGWIGFAGAAAGRHQACCWESVGDVGACCPGCRLEKDGAFTVRGRAETTGASGDGTVSLEGDDRVVVLFRAEGGRLDRVRSFSAGCVLDAGGLPFVWLTGVRPADSVKLLRSLVSSGVAGGKSGKRVDEQALAALAFHAEPSALDALIDMARHDASAHARGQALFWLAGRAGEKAAGVITRAIEEDPETEVKKRAVFALSQLPRDEGVPLLIDTARRNRNPVVRKQAMFWLGQSNDPRALSFFEEVLKP